MSFKGSIKFVLTKEQEETQFRVENKALLFPKGLKSGGQDPKETAPLAAGDHSPFWGRLWRGKKFPERRGDEEQEKFPWGVLRSSSSEKIQKGENPDSKSSLIDSEGRLKQEGEDA